jgi:hypothetical protein
VASSAHEIGPATRADIAGILELQEPNLRENGGALSVRFTADDLEAALGDMPISVARRSGRIVGYLLSSSKAAQAHVPIIQAMLRAYPGEPDAYVYGPICVAESERGQDLPARLVRSLRERLPGREGITFIRKENVRSLRAHAKIGGREVAEFVHGGAVMVVISFAG